jgi:hypothetical protein
MGSRTGLDDMENRKFLLLSGLELRLLGRQARSQSLYRLRHPDLEIAKKVLLKCVKIPNICEGG